MRSMGSLGPSVFLHGDSKDSKDSDQTGRMHRLIGVIAGHTSHFLGFVMPRLIFKTVLLRKCKYNYRNLDRVLDITYTQTYS